MPNRAALVVGAAAILLTGLIATVVLLVDAQERPGRQIDAFARAGVGCTTELRIERAGEYFVYAELGAEPVARAGCVPVGDPTARFSVEVDGVPTMPDDRTITYSRGVVSAASVQRLIVDAPTDLVVRVVGSDPGVVAAIGPDPDDGVDDRRTLALALGAATLIVGGGALLFSSRRPARVNLPVADGSDRSAHWGPPGGPIDPLLGPPSDHRPSRWAPPRSDQRMD